MWADGERADGAVASVSGRELGASASNLLAGYQEVNELIDAVGLIMDMHNTLQDVPSDWLRELATTQTTSAHELNEGSAVLKESLAIDKSFV